MGKGPNNQHNVDKKHPKPYSSRERLLEEKLILSTSAYLFCSLKEKQLNQKSSNIFGLYPAVYSYFKLHGIDRAYATIKTQLNKSLGEKFIGPHIQNLISLWEDAIGNKKVFEPEYKIVEDILIEEIPKVNCNSRIIIENNDTMEEVQGLIQNNDKIINIIEAIRSDFSDTTVIENHVPSENNIIDK